MWIITPKRCVRKRENEDEEALAPRNAQIHFARPLFPTEETMKIEERYIDILDRLADKYAKVSSPTMVESHRRMESVALELLKLERGGKSDDILPGDCYPHIEVRKN